METAPRRILTRCLLRPADVRPQFEGFEIIGTFNPAAIEFDDGVVLLVPENKDVVLFPEKIDSQYVALVRREDHLLVYYGAADTATGVAQYSLSDLSGSVTPT